MSSFPDAWSAVRGRPWRFLASAWPWRSVAYVGTTVPAGLAVLAALFVVVGIGVLTVVVLVGVLVLLQVPLLARIVAAVERWRLGLVQPRSSGRRTSLPEQVRVWRTLPIAWSEIGYAVLLSTVFLVVDFLALVLLVLPVTFVAAPLLRRADPAGIDLAGWRVDSATEAWAAVPVGFALLVVVVYVVASLACGQAALTRLLLDPPEQRLSVAVADLRRSRSGLVDAFEAERHRIERDLHDGVQQQLLALTMALGSAELEIDDGPGLELVQAAHRQAENALADLRAIVRGIHPRVLTERGLAAAVNEIADRSPVPVDIDMVLPDPLPGRVANAAYFVASEALANIARHAAARRAEVRAWVEQTDGVRELVLTVTDDGVGGAEPARGSGLAGLAARVEALDGTLAITSPAGGPTRLRVTCPIR